MGAELVALFEESVVDVRHLSVGERYTVGEATQASLPLAGLGALRELVRVGGTGIELVHVDEVRVEVLDRDMALTWTRELPHDRLVAVLPDGTRARLTHGALTLLVSPGSAPRRAALDPKLELRDYVATVGVGVLALLGLLMLNAIPPSSPSLAIDDVLLRTRAARFVITAPEAPKSPPSSMKTAGLAGGSSPPPMRVQRASAPAAKQAGVAKKSGSPTGARDAAELAASSAGILGLMAEFTHTGSTSGGTSALGAQGTAAMGEITAVGCASCGTGERWASDSIFTGEPSGRADTIAAGPIGSRGGGHVPHGPALALEYETRTIVELRPDVRVNEGPFSKEIIRRVVHAHMKEYQFCYEQQLQHDASLTGRVVPKFTIAANGRVIAAVLESSSLGNALVESCVVAATRRLEFPKGQGTGLSIVSYPFVFKTAAQN